MTTSDMSTRTSASRVWPIIWLLIAVIFIPSLLSLLFFDTYQMELTLFFALFGLVIWLVAQGGGWRIPERGTAVIIGDTRNNYYAHTRADGGYIFMPLYQYLVALMPTYPLTFEYEITSVDTQTRYLSRINRIRVRTTCTITDPRTFYIKSAAYLDRILEIEATTKLRRTHLALWKQLLHDVMEIKIDNSVRDVVWRWHEYLAKDPSLKVQTTFSLKKLGDLDPFDLSVNRQNLANQVTNELRGIARSMGVSIEPLSFESVEIEQGLVSYKNLDQEWEMVKAQRRSALEAIPIVERGKAEAEVRATTLAMLLDVLINQYDIPHTDPLIAQVVKAALYSDEVIWKAVLDQAPAAASKARTVG